MTAQVAICALTFHRPEGIRSLLQGLGSLRIPPGHTVRAVVVDNDEQGSAAEIVEQAARHLPFPLLYVVEPHRGIATARNTAVRAAGDADLVAFVDDDEVPEPSWLEQLLEVQQRTGADVVTGPVLPRFEVAPPAWVLRGGFFERPRYADGSPLPYARTSNVLIAGALLAGDAPPFDTRFDETGGEDTHFFLKARLGGARIAWADRACVTESVPPSRVGVRWILRRSYRRGTTLSVCLRDLRDTWPRRLRRVAKAATEMLSGALRTMVGLARGRDRVVAGLQQIAYGAGLLTGLFGAGYAEYRTIHGR